MSRLTNAVSWDGRTVTLLLFTLWPLGTVERPLAVSDVVGGTQIRRYELVDSGGMMPCYSCVEFDIAFDSLPGDLERVVSEWLHAALASGAVLAWFGFEGSFSFAHLLTVEVADQIFGIGDSSGVAAALGDEERHSAEWQRRLAQARETVIPSGP